MNEGPQHPYEATITVGAETPEKLDELLKEALYQTNAAAAGPSSVLATGASGGFFVVHFRRREVEVERFRLELAAWCRQRRPSSHLGDAVLDYYIKEHDRREASETEVPHTEGVPSSRCGGG